MTMIMSPLSVLTTLEERRTRQHVCVVDKFINQVWTEDREEDERVVNFRVVAFPRERRKIIRMRDYGIPFYSLGMIIIRSAR